MDNDFSLVVPTYNRSQDLARLLSYLKREKMSCPILVLDSSALKNRPENQRIVQEAALSITYLEYPEEIKPFDKFYDGVCQVKTQFCQLCADDDLILVKELGKCVEQLKLDPTASVAHGYYFTFSEDNNQAIMSIPQILYYSPTIDAHQPIKRLEKLFSHYQALTYGIYRTAILKRILSTIRSVDKILARELLASALAVVYGKAIRLPIFTHGRSQGASQNYQYWHPLEWLFRAPAGLFNSYAQYKSTLVAELITMPDNQGSPEHIERMVDLIHMDYLLRHAPPEAYEFLLAKTMVGKSVDDVWQAHEVQIPLIHAAKRVKRYEETGKRLLASKIVDVLGRIIRQLLKKDKTDLDSGSLEKVTTTIRTYLFDKNFLSSNFSGISVTASEISQLTMALDNYY